MGRSIANNTTQLLLFRIIKGIFDCHFQIHDPLIEISGELGIWILSGAPLPKLPEDYVAEAGM